MVPIEPDFWSKTSWIQISYGIWVNQIFICVGIVFGFSAVALPQIRKEFQPTLAQLALMASIITLSPPIGSILSGLSVDRLGRRTTLMVCVLPFAVGWACIGFAKSPNAIIVGRVITGLGIGMGAPTVFTFTTEISLPNIRGFLGVMPTTSVGLGVTAQAIFGSFLNWRTLCYMACIYSIVLSIMNLFLPESPYYVLMKGNLEDTKKNLQKFRARDYDVEGEMESLKAYKEKRHLHNSSTKEYIRALFAPTAYKPFIIIALYNACCQFAGVTVQTFYAVDYLRYSNSSINPLYGNIVLGVTRLVAATILSALVVNLKRRPIAIASGLAIAAIYLPLGIFLLSYKKPSVVPLICMAMYTVPATVGVTLPPMMAFELIPLEIRGLLGGMSLSMLNLLTFTANFSFPYLRIHIGFPETIILYGSVALTGVVYLFFLLPETKGVSLQELEERYRAKKPQAQEENITNTTNATNTSNTTNTANKTNTTNTTNTKDTTNATNS